MTSSNQTAIRVTKQFTIVSLAVTPCKVFVATVFNGTQPILKVMVIRMFLMTQKLQILRPVIMPNLISVMNNFLFMNYRSTNNFLHHNNMLKSIACLSCSMMMGFVNHYITFIIDELTASPSRVSISRPSQFKNRLPILLPSLRCPNILSTYPLHYQSGEQR